MKLSRVQFVHAVAFRGVEASTSRTGLETTELEPWDIEVTPLGLTITRPLFEAVWVPLANVKGGVIAQEHEVEDVELAPEVLVCPHCEHEAKNKAGLSAHIRFKHKEVAA